MDPGLRAHIEQSAERHAPGSWVKISSMAIHDVQVLARHMPAATMFVPSIGGISHASEAGNRQLKRYRSRLAWIMVQRTSRSRQETGQLPACVQARHDMDPIDIVSIDNPPWLFNQFPVGEDIPRSHLGNDAAAFRQCGEGLATPFQSRERGKSVRRILLGNELDDSFAVGSRRACPQDLEISHP